MDFVLGFLVVIKIAVEVLVILGVVVFQIVLFKVVTKFGRNLNKLT